MARDDALAIRVSMNLPRQASTRRALEAVATLAQEAHPRTKAGDARHWVPGRARDDNYRDRDDNYRAPRRERHFNICSPHQMPGVAR